MKIRSITSTDLFTGTARQPRQVVRATVSQTPYARFTVRVMGPTVTTPEPALVSAGADAEVTVDVGVVIAAPAPEGSVHRVTAIAESGFGSDGAAPRAHRATRGGAVTAAATGWTMWMVSHFHYDPVWWETQAGFTESCHDLPAAGRERPKTTVLSAFDLVRTKQGQRAAEIAVLDAERLSTLAMLAVPDGYRYAAEKLDKAEDVVTVSDPEHRGGAAAGILAAALGPAELVLTPGAEAELTLTLTGAAASQIRGEAQLISPFGTWGPDGVRAGPWTAGFTIEPGQTSTVTFTVTAPRTARPGAHWWAMAKVAWFGRVQYTPAVAIRITPGIT